jgi:hypothetical protein
MLSRKNVKVSPVKLIPKSIPKGGVELVKEILAQSQTSEIVVVSEDKKVKPPLPTRPIKKNSVPVENIQELRSFSPTVNVIDTFAANF